MKLSYCKFKVKEY